MNEGRLITAAAEGDSHAIREIYDRYESLVYSVARRISGDHDLACDCAQEAWIRAIRSLSSYRGDARFSSWLHRIAVNVTIQVARQKDRRARRDAVFLECRPAASSAGDVLLEKRLDEAIDRLPDGMRRVLVLHDVEGYTHEQIGEVLGVSSGTSKSQLFKARARMRELLTLETGKQETAPRDAEGVEAWNT